MPYIKRAMLLSLKAIPCPKYFVRHVSMNADHARFVPMTPDSKDKTYISDFNKANN
jgi:hypothetical protein